MNTPIIIPILFVLITQSVIASDNISEANSNNSSCTEMLFSIESAIDSENKGQFFEQIKSFVSHFPNQRWLLGFLLHNPKCGPNCIQALFKEGADLHVPSNILYRSSGSSYHIANNTPLCSRIMMQDLDAVAALLEHGAHPTLGIMNLRTPAHLIIESVTWSSDHKFATEALKLLCRHACRRYGINSLMLEQELKNSENGRMESPWEFLISQKKRACETDNNKYNAYTCKSYKKLIKEMSKIL